MKNLYNYITQLKKKNKEETWRVLTFNHENKRIQNLSYL